MKNLALIASAASLALLGACSSSDNAGDAATDAPTAMASETASPAAIPSAAAEAADKDTLALEGIGDLQIGKPVPSGSSFASRGAQIPGSTCKTLSSPDYPDVYAMTVDGEVRRITVSGDSPVKLVEGIGPGSTEAQVKRAFPGFVESPHKYVEAPAKYLTQPGKDPRLMLEIDKDGTVSAVHVGMMPQLAYVEGCA